MRAPCLETGGVIGICAPSHIARPDEYGPVLEAIKRKGFRVRKADNLYRDTDGYLATPRERAADFNQLIADPCVGLILFNGGKGSVELLPYLDYEQIKRTPKRICSFSDGTNILAAVWAMTGLETYYGQYTHVFDGLRCYDFDHFMGHLVRGDVREHFANSRWLALKEGEAEGILLGGYLRNFVFMLSNRYFPLDLSKRYLLFVEDHEMFGGVDYVSALLSHIEQNDFIDSVAGLVFGQYSAKPQPYLQARLRRFGKEHGIPVAACDDFGHGGSHGILPLGRKAFLRVGQDCCLRYL